jgi:glycosyltransferase involved in cell wall biosynthesis
VRDRTVFTGYVTNPELALGAMDFFALTSRLEGLPLAMLEAWAAGLPVVASAVSGIKRIVEPGRTGLLFPDGDLPALINALRSVLKDPDQARRMAEAGRAVVRQSYSLERMAGDYERRYRDLLSGAGRSK